MLFKKKVTEKFMITIPEPCSEDWNKMSVVDREQKHCASCAKNVVDFTSMSDEEIVLFFRHNKHNTCGRFSHEQLKKTFTALPVTSRSATWWKAAMLLPLSLLSKNVSAQQDSIPASDSLTAVNDTIPETEELISDSSIVQEDSLTTQIESVAITESENSNDTTPAPESSIQWVNIDPGSALGGFTQQIVMGDVCMPISPVSVAVGFINAVPMPPPAPTLTFLPLWSRYSKNDPNKDDLVLETDPRKVSDPAEPKQDPVPPPIPESPWYEAILPPSLRPRRNG